MNKFRKFCPNVYVAECDAEHGKGDIIDVETQYGKDVSCKVHNLVKAGNGVYFYSITRIEDQSYAERKSARYHASATSHTKKSDDYYRASNEGREFLALGEPIKAGHHSEHRHRALIERNSRRMDKCMEYAEKAKTADEKAEYWDGKAGEITLAMPESLGYYKAELEKAVEVHKQFKNGAKEREHAYSLTYAAKNVKGLKNKVEIATLLWEG